MAQPRPRTEDPPFRRHSVSSPPSPACRISSPSPILVGRPSREAAGPPGSRAGPRPTASNCPRRSSHERFTSSVQIFDAEHVPPSTGPRPVTVAAGRVVAWRGFRIREAREVLNAECCTYVNIVVLALDHRHLRRSSFRAPGGTMHGH